MASHKIRVDERALRFTCVIGKHRTDLDAGHPHGAGEARGSVFPEPLSRQGALTLWLEHVVDTKTDERAFWLMWYRAGKPVVSWTPVLDADEVAALGERLAGVG